MDMKRFSSAALALALTASLTTPAFADGLPAGAARTAVPTKGLLISPNPISADLTGTLSEHYNGVVSINGTEIESVTYSKPIEGSWESNDVVYTIEELPGAPAGYVPMRLLCQATEGGFASWLKEHNRSMFGLNETLIITNFDDNTIYIRDENRQEILQEGYTCFLRQGITYLPVEFLNTLDGVSVNSYNMDGKEYNEVTIEVPGTPMEKLVKKIQEALSLQGGMDVNEYFTMQELDVSAFDEIVGEMPMINIRADVVVIAKWAEDADKEAGKAALKAVQDQMISNFETYLPGPYEVAKNGQIVESEDGKYVMLILSEDNDRAAQLFQEGIVELEAENGGIQPR